MTHDFNYDYISKRYVIKYTVNNHQVITYLDGKASYDELMEWRAYHMSIVRDLALKYLTKDDQVRDGRDIQQGV